MTTQQQKFNERAWYFIAFIAWAVIAWSATSSKPSYEDPCVEKGNCPEEFDMRNGDIW